MEVRIFLLLQNALYTKVCIVAGRTSMSRWPRTGSTRETNLVSSPLIVKIHV